MINAKAIHSQALWRLTWLAEHYRQQYKASHDVDFRECCACSCGAVLGYERNAGFQCDGCLRVYDWTTFRGTYKQPSRRGLCAHCRAHGIPPIVNPGALVLTRHPSRNARIGVSRSLRFRILSRDRFRCRYCGRSGSAAELEVDHVIPVSEGGDNKEENLVTACYDCNRSKGSRLVA
jgi:5-methylcytosine-specific restriction endonuclease McrA